MNKFIEEKMVPIAGKIGAFRPLVALRDGITLTLPLIIIGSAFLIIASFPIAAVSDFFEKTGISGYLYKGLAGSFDIMGLVAAFGIANSYAKQYKVDGVSAGVISLSAYLVVTPYFTATTEKGEKIATNGINSAYMGSKGLFVAIIIGLVSAYIFQWFINHNVQIKLPEAVPPAVARSFSALIPGAVIISLAIVVFAVVDHTSAANIHDLIAKVLGGPLGLLGGTLPGTVIAIFLNSLFWFMGIHGANVVNSIISPIWLQNTGENLAVFQADKTAKLPHIITAPFMDNFVFMGGGGATIGLVIVIAILARHKKSSSVTKTIAPLTLAPGIFNINEPAMFGIPIVLNVSLLIPFILAPVANAVITYFGMATGIVHGTVGATVSWTMPPILSGWLATGGHISGALVQIICIIVDIVIYYPFYKIVERQLLIDEGKGETSN